MVSSDGVIEGKVHYIATAQLIKSQKNTYSQQLQHGIFTKELNK